MLMQPASVIASATSAQTTKTNRTAPISIDLTNYSSIVRDSKYVAENLTLRGKVPRRQPPCPARSLCSFLPYVKAPLAALNISP